MKSIIVRTLIAAFSMVVSGCATPACIMSTRNAIPAYRLPAQFHTCSRKSMIPLDLSLLGQKRPEDGHRLGKGDLVGVYVAGILPPKVDDQALVLPPVAIGGNIYYPPFGRINTPQIGIPLELRENGCIRLPLVGRLKLDGLTLDEATETLRTAYESKSLIVKGRERVYMSLIRSRTHRVVVLRDDAHSPSPSFIPKIGVPFTKIGRGEVIDLPAYENDVLHALTSSGGLPGIDAFSEVWIFRNRDEFVNDPAAIQQEIEQAGSVDKFAQELVKRERQVVRLPLRVDPSQPQPFDADDVILQDGDVIYLPPRETEYFYTGGQIPGGRVPLPRDKDLDIVEAISLANSSVGGPSNLSIFNAGAGTIYPPTQVLIVRKLPNDQQLRIRVDLNRALNNPNERILIQPDDHVFLFFKPSELYSNLILNYIGVGFSGSITHVAQ